MTREPDPTGFDDIVASWQREGGVPQWPDDDQRLAGDRTPPDDLLPADDLPPPVDRVPPDDRVPPHDLPPRDGRAPADGPARADDLPVDDPLLDAGAGAAEPNPGDGVLGRPSGPALDPLADEHFVPPEPPPIPRIGPPMLVGLTLIGIGLVLLTFPGWVGVPQVYGLPLGLVAIAAGLGWLVLRLWPDSADSSPPIYLDDPDDPDGGAVL